MDFIGRHTAHKVGIAESKQILLIALQLRRLESLVDEFMENKCEAEKGIRRIP